MPTDALPARQFIAHVPMTLEDWKSDLCRSGYRSLRRKDAAANPQIIATHTAAQAR